MEEVIKHYDKLIEENNDPVFDPLALKEYMDGWDGKSFIDEMKLDKSKSVLEIGCGTGRLAMRVCPLVGSFTGIDISPKTVELAKHNLQLCSPTIILGNFYARTYHRMRHAISLIAFHISHLRKSLHV
jgi:ubiquinone/menaquinone biosynthesis C-methylase UbiE